MVIGVEEKSELGFQIALAQRAVLIGDNKANMILLGLLKIKEALADEWVPINTTFSVDQTADPV